MLLPGVHGSHLSWEKVLVPSLGSAGRGGQSRVPPMLLPGMVWAGCVLVQRVSQGPDIVRELPVTSPCCPLTLARTDLGQDWGFFSITLVGFNPLWGLVFSRGGTGATPILANEAIPAFFAPRKGQWGLLIRFPQELVFAGLTLLSWDA